MDSYIRQSGENVLAYMQHLALGSIQESKTALGKEKGLGVGQPPRVTNLYWGKKLGYEQWSS